MMDVEIELNGKINGSIHSIESQLIVDTLMHVHTSRDTEID